MIKNTAGSLHHRHIRSQKKFCLTKIGGWVQHGIFTDLFPMFFYYFYSF